MSAGGCGHGMPSPGSCVDCMNDGPLPPPAKPTRAGWPFSATFEGACIGEPACSGIEPGDQIVRMSDGGYRHAGTCERHR